VAEVGDKWHIFGLKYGLENGCAVTLCMLFQAIGVSEFNYFTLVFPVQFE